MRPGKYFYVLHKSLNGAFLSTLVVKSCVKKKKSLATHQIKYISVHSSLDRDTGNSCYQSSGCDLNIGLAVTSGDEHGDERRTLLLDTQGTRLL